MTALQIRLALAAVGAVLAFDTVAALASRSTGVGYAWFGILEIVLYLAIGFAAGTMTRTWRGGLGVVVIAAIAEALVGWWISAAIGPGRPPAGATPALIAMAALFAITWNGCVGLVGSVLGARYARSRTPS